MTVSQNVFKGFSLFGKWQSLSSRCWLHHQTDLNLFLKLPIHLFPIYDPQLGFHITWWNCPNCSKSLVNRHQPVMAASQPLNAKSLSLHSPPVHQLLYRNIQGQWKFKSMPDRPTDWHGYCARDTCVSNINISEWIQHWYLQFFKN